LRSILYYITGHGYGHAVRSSQVIRALKRAAADLRVYVRTTAQEWLFDDVDYPISYSHYYVDVGLIQPNSLHMDLRDTLQACQALQANSQHLISREINFIKQTKIDLIVGDIPPMCFEIAARTGIPSVAITNFTWDVIYQAYISEYPGFAPLVEAMTRFYGKANLALTLPYPCEMSMFPQQEAIPWITRVSKLTRTQARNQFGLPNSATVVLLSFGGLGLQSFPWHSLQKQPEYFFVTTGSERKLQDNLLVLDNAQRRYEDLLRGVDVVVTKPGYGIVADALSHRVPVLYTDRGEFPEYPRLVQALSELGTAEYIAQKALLAGDLKTDLENILGKPPSWPEVPLNGATAATTKVLAFLDDCVR